jgi:hypothetical protein
MNNGVPCKYFRNRKMYVSVQEKSACAQGFDPNAFSHCWCNETLSEVGRDDRLVSFQRCCDPARACHQLP